MNPDITEQVVGIVKRGLLIFSHGGGSSYMAAIFTDKRIIVIQLEKYEKWLCNNGGILRNEMLEDLSQIISKKRIWEWDFQISLDKIARIKTEHKKKLLFIPISARLEIIPKTRIIPQAYEFAIKDDNEFNKLENIIISLFGSSDYRYRK